MNWLYECDRCSYSKRAAWPFSVYMLASTDSMSVSDRWSSYLPIQTNTSWCYGCANITISERIRPLDVLGDQLRRLHVNESRSSYPHPQSQYEARDTPRRVEWRRRRISPPKCLECGDTKIELMVTDNFELILDDEAEYIETKFDITHPGCGGRFVNKGGAFLQFGGMCMYTPEGDSIEGNIESASMTD